MADINALSRVTRYDGSFFYIVELGFSNGLYKYILADWDANQLLKPILIYSHTKRSSLTKSQQEYFDNNLLSMKRINKYISGNNTYIGGIDSTNNRIVREIKENVVKPKNYEVYVRDNNYILVEYLKQDSFDDINSYKIYEFLTSHNNMLFDEKQIYTELDLLKLEEEMQEPVFSVLLDKDRINNKIRTDGGYVGTIKKNGTKYIKVRKESNEKKIASRKPKSH